MKQHFGELKGQEVFLYTIENDNIRMAVTDYGATLVSFVHKKSNTDIVLGFDSIDGYLDQTSYIGASIGRTANRIEKGVFNLNGKTYHLPINNNGNCNHGGIIGFDKVIWNVEEKADAITFTYLSKDGEEGYPGNLNVKVTYTLLENGIEIKAEGTPDADTLFAYTNHSYFNLDGSGTALNHEVKILSDVYALSDANGLALNEIVPVEGTPFDFREFHEPAERIGEDDIQLKYGNGYDHYYPIKGDGMRLFAICKGKQLTMEVYSDQPGMHFYSANYLEGKTGKNSNVYDPRTALCFECAYMPNAISYDGVKKPLVHTGETSVQTMRYVIEEND